MSDYNAEDVRNIALVGHAGAGKTTLVEALLAAAGAIREPGSVDQGHDGLRLRRHGEGPAALAGRGHHRLHDPRQAHQPARHPRLPDFLGRALSVLSAVETAAIVINAENGIEPMTQRMWKAADNRNLCRMFIVNRIDADGVDLAT
jgi:elongation factor G